MSNFLISTSCQANCIHSGSFMIFKSTNKKVLVEKMPLLIRLDNPFSDDIDIMGCSLTIVGSPHPCLTTKWMRVTAKVLTNNKPFLIDPDSGMCYAGGPNSQSQAFVKAGSFQKKVKGF